MISQTCCISVDTIYPNGYKIPSGYRAADFRVPRKGDEGLIPGYNNPYKWDEDAVGTPRIILERVKRKRVIFEPTEEKRRVKRGEWASDGVTFFRWTSILYEESIGEYQIFTMREEEF